MEAVDVLAAPTAGRGGRPHDRLLGRRRPAARPRADHMPSGQLADAVRDARRAAGHLATATPRATPRTLTRLADDLAQADELLECASDDVRGADLSSADLTHLYLGGLRWDESTRWPEQLREQLRTDSDLVDGTHQLRDH